MRIGISGVSSTGKSTLAKAFHEVNPEFDLLHDTQVHEETWALMDQRNWTPHTRYFPDMLPEEHVNFERCITDVRMKWEDEHDNYIADESPLDFLNYCYITCAPYPNLMPPEELDNLLARWRNLFAKYDLIWYLPFGALTKIEDDGRRFKDKHLLQHWDNSMRGLVDHLASEYGLVGKRKPMLGIMEMQDLEHRVKAVTESVAFLRKLN